MKRLPLQIQRVRQKPHWIITFVVLGFDDEFVFYLPGSWSESFATANAKVVLSRQLNIDKRTIILQNCRKVNP